MTRAAFCEESTLKAITQLRRKYPYAAALLAYVAVERILKVHFLTNRHHLNLPAKKLTGGPHKGESLAALASLRDGPFMRDVVCHMTLGNLEEALKLAQSARSSKHRNEVVHSNLYLSGEASMTPIGRRRKDLARLKQAVAHLRHAVDKFTSHRLLEKRNGDLLTQPNPAIQPTGSAGG
jgi:hypothetical protein